MATYIDKPNAEKQQNKSNEQGINVTQQRASFFKQCNNFHQKHIVPNILNATFIAAFIIAAPALAISWLTKDSAKSERTNKAKSAL